ncbi:MAG: LytTR family DNA-binding domain-containing protein [Lachnospiraceae bacterium]|nr:LytTR family DNA-binding domain-containing protein [Lachnospiraceae bacterium]
MVHVYICEDNKNQLNILEDYVKKSIVIEDLDMALVLATENPYALLEKAEASESTGLYFLDIDLHTDLNGLELAQKIRKIDSRCFIVFITSHSEMSYLTFQYKVEALDFILKDRPKEIQTRIRECLLNAMERYQSSCNKISKVFTITLDQHITTVELDEILYFKTCYNIHHIFLCAKNRCIEFTAQMKEIQEQLDNRFYRSHRSCIINKQQVQEVDFSKGIIYMKNGDICPLSVRMKRGLKNSLEQTVFQHFSD